MNEKYESFSERERIVPKQMYRYDLENQGARNAIYNQIYNFLNFNEEPFDYDWPRPGNAAWDCVYRDHFWGEFCLEPIDEYQGRDFVRKMLVDDDPWYRVFEFIEYILSKCGGGYEWGELNAIYNKQRAESLTYSINEAMEKTRVGYKIVDNQFVPRFSEIEQQEVDKASNTKFNSANKHLLKSQKFLGDYKNPDDKNSIKESISAVESIAREVTGNKKATLGQLTRNLNFHPAFASGLNQLYGFTSDADSVRHGGTSDKHFEINQATARFMLVICSAFVNYIISQNPKI